ncbi:hypothetical protein GCM10027093_19220 [Paraburkholderia jirisanensis]
MTLASMQRDFRAWLAGSSTAAAARLATVAPAGLAVYQNNYRAQLVGCLEESFPQLRTWLGEDAFREAAITHIDTHAPHAFTLDAYPSGFGATLAALYPHNPDLHELAWIEQALGEAFVAADAVPLTPDALVTIDWDSARLQLTPSLRHRVATTNAQQLWSALRAGTTAPEATMLAEPGELIVWRRAFTCYVAQVDALERIALLQLQRDGSFAALCTLLVERLGEADGIARAGALLAGWLGNELISGVDQA